MLVQIQPGPIEEKAILDGIDIQVNKFLPKTVRDKDGNEVELLGVMVSAPPEPVDPFDLDAWPPRIVMLTGKKVEK